MRDLVGEEIGPYKVVEKLGRGGMADVYKAFHVDLEINRAIKVIRPEFVAAEDFKVRFQREAKAVAALQHPNIVQIHDFGSHDGNYYMVMEFVEGKDLKHLIKSEGAIRPISRAIQIVQKVATALHYAHGKSLLHRDIKPENIMLRADDSPVLMDFGIAKLLSADTQLTQTGVGIGTPSYMSPEQAQATETLGPASDLYSLTVVLYEMLTGQVPYSADTPIAVMLKVISDPLPLPRQLSPDISEPLQQLLIKGTAKDPQRRYLNGEEFANALQGLVETSEPAGSEQTVLVDPPAQSGQQAVQAADNIQQPRKPGRLIPGLLLGVMLIAALSYFYASSPDDSLESEESSIGRRSAPDAAESMPTSSPNTQSSNAPIDEQEGVVASGSAVANHQVIIEFQGRSTKAKPIVRDLQLNKGDTLYLNVHDTSSTTDFVLQNKQARKPEFSSYSDSGPHTVEKSGEYQLSITPRRDEAEVDVELWRLSPAELHGGVAPRNAFIDGGTKAPGQTVRYQVDLEENEVLFFDVLKTSATTDFSIVYPDGRRNLLKPTYSDKGPLKVEQNGRYSILVDPRGDAVVDYEFKLHAYQPMVIEKGELSYAEWQESATEFPGQSVVYALDTSKADTLYLEIGDVSATTDFIIASQDGRTKLLSTYSDTGEALEIPDDQNYQLMVDPRGDRLSEFEFRLHRLESVNLDGGVIELGQYIAGKTQLPGQSIRYSLTVNVGQEVNLEVLRSAVTTDFQLLAPDGRTSIYKSYVGSNRPIVLPSAGSYTLIADPRGSKLADFELRLIAEADSR